MDVSCVSQRRVNFLHCEGAVQHSIIHRSLVRLGGKARKPPVRNVMEKRILWACCFIEPQSSFIYDPKEDEVKLSNLKDHMVC
jgi:hypothetical protein